MKLIVPNDYLEKSRLDKYITELTELSRSQITKMIEDEVVLVNNQPKKASYKVNSNDSIEFDETYINEPDLIEEEMNINIVYEDESLLIVNKPSGLVVHPGNGNKNHTLVNGLMHYTKNLSDLGGEARPGIVHRIDKDTSGLLIVAKNNKAHDLLSKMFSIKEIKREYIALVIGEFPHQSATIDAPIGRSEKNRKQMTVTDKNSKFAITHLEVLKRFVGYTLIKLSLETGRTHQIRVHLQYIGYPVFNDPVYTNNNCSVFGQFLHSSRIEFVHPITNKLIDISCPIPSEFSKFIDELEPLNK